MLRIPTRAVLMIGATLLLAHAEAQSSPTYCPVTVRTDPLFGPRRVQVRTAPGCATLARIRKRSTINPRVIVPTRGAWPVTPDTTLNVWVFTFQIEYWTGRGWVAAPDPGRGSLNDFSAFFPPPVWEPDAD